MQLLKPFFIVAVIAALAASGFAYFETNKAELSTAAAISGPLDVRTAGDRLPGFNFITNNPPVPDVKMFDVDGNPASLESFKGKVVLFNLWATWCPPCIREMPDLNALVAEYKDRGFIVVPVASGRQGKEEPTEFLQKRGLDELTTYYDPHSQFLQTFGIDSLPTTLVIDRDGNMRGGVLGILDWSSDDAKALIEAFLEEQQS